MKTRLVGVALAGTLMIATTNPNALVVPAPVHFLLPTTASTRSLLDVATHFSEFVDVANGASTLPTYVSYPDRADRAPVVLVSGTDGMTDWLRAVGVQLSRAGFIAVVPDTTAADLVGTARALDYTSHLPASNGTRTRVEFSLDSTLIVARAASRSAAFPLNDDGWSAALTYLREQTHNTFVPPALDLHILMQHEAAFAPPQQQAVGGNPGGGASGEGGQSLSTKTPDLPPHLQQSKAALAHSPRKSEWADIALTGGGKLHTFIVYPAGTAPSPVVVVIHGGGYGFNDWIRAVADQLAQEGFIALAPDLISGMGPNGGNTDSFEFPDDVLKTIGKLGPNALVRVKAAREFGLKLPRANGKSATLGFCLGGGLSFQMAAEGVNAAVVYYGGAPRPETMEKISAPVIGFYGGDDARLTASVEPAKAAIAKLGKSYEPHVYKHATHAFLEFQDLSDNFIATKDSWPRAVAFLKEHTK